MVAVKPELQMNSTDKVAKIKSQVLTVVTLDYSSDGKQIISGGAQPVVRVWDMVNAKGLFALPVPAEYGVGSLAYSKDGKLIAASGVTGVFSGFITRLRLPRFPRRPRWSTPTPSRAAGRSSRRPQRFPSC